MGIGYDVQVEEKLKKLVPSQCHFFGADPVVQVNKQIYERIGKYFPFAVSAIDGFGEAQVLGCEEYLCNMNFDL